MDGQNLLSEDEASALRTAGRDDTPPVPRPGEVVDVNADHWERIPADRVPALESIAERLASRLKQRGHHLFRQPIEVLPRAVRTERWGNYAARLPVPASLNVLELRPLDLKAAICLEAGFLFALVDFFFGGDGQAERPAAWGELTPVETRLASRFAGELALDMKSAWKAFVDVEFTPAGSETSPALASVAGSSEPVCIAGFDLLVAGREFTVDIVLPAPLIESVRHLRDAGDAARGKAESQRWRTRLRTDMQDARVNLRAVLATAELSLRDLVAAQPGDIIPVDLPPTLTLYADDTPLLEGSYGTHQGRNAVRITRPASRTTVGEKYGQDQDERRGS